MNETRNKLIDNADGRRLTDMSFAGIPARCEHCGFDFSLREMPFMAAQVVIKNVNTNCPRCNRPAQLRDGVYSLVERVVETAARPEISRDSLAAFQTVAQAARSGQISSEEAVAQANQIGSALGNLLEWSVDNFVPLSLLISAIALVITIYSTISADEGSAQAHADAQIEMQALSSLKEVQQKIYEELKKETDHFENPAAPSSPTRLGIARDKAQRLSSATNARNRHERRKAERVLKKPRSRSS